MPSRLGRFASLLTCGLALLALVAAGKARADALDDLLAGELLMRKYPGLSVAVVRDGEIVRTAAAGLANLELGAPVTTNTVFQIQSITKTFTSAAILLLAEEGRLKLDDPVSKYLEGTPDSWKAVTIRHLLNHTSGIKDFINEPTASLRLEVTEEEVFQVAITRSLNFPTGERYAYSNTNYHLLAMIVRKLTNKAYGDFLAERIFKPLGMEHTRIFARDPVLPGRAAGYQWTGSEHRNGEFVAESILGYGGGGILATASDLARWAGAMMEGRVLEPESRREAWTPGRLRDGSATSYGLGWGISTSNGHRDVGHNGGHSTGFTSSLVIYPDDRLAVVVLSNLGGGEPNRIARKIAGLYVPELAPRPAVPIEDPQPEIAALLRECIERIPEWRLEEARFGSELWRVLSERRQSIQADLQALGTLKKIELLSRSGTEALRTCRYRVTFSNGKLPVTLTRDATGRITGLDAGGEE